MATTAKIAKDLKKPKFKIGVDAQHDIKEFAGRVFGIKNSLISWAFAAAFFTAGAIGSTLGARALYGVAAFGCLAVWATARRTLAGAVRVAPVAAPATS